MLCMFCTVLYWENVHKKRTGEVDITYCNFVFLSPDQMNVLVMF